MGHSPFYMLFQKEPFAANEFSYNNVNNLDMADYVQRSINDRVFTKILRERLLKYGKREIAPGSCRTGPTRRDP
jgi:phage tail sheath gpL-like